MPIKKHFSYQSAFYAIIIYYWVILNISFSRYSYSSPAVDSVFYLATVIPITVFSLLVTMSTILNNRRTVNRLPYLSSWLSAFAILVAVFSLVKGEPRNAIGFVLLMATVAVFFVRNFQYSISLFNILFLLTFIISLLLSATGHYYYRLLPGDLSVGDVAAWRVSIFPYAIFGSAVFSLLAFVVNVESTKVRTTWVVLPVSAYFLVLSGSRAIIICFLAYVSFSLISRYQQFPKAPIYRWLILSSVLVVFLIMGGVEWLAENIHNEWLYNFIFKSESEPGQIEIDRVSVWQAHVGAWLSSPILGARTGDLIVYHHGLATESGSESFATRALALSGIAFAFLLMAFREMVRRVLRDGNRLGYIMLLFLAILSITYSSFFSAYDFLFLSMIVLAASPSGARRTKPLLAGPESVFSDKK